MKIVRVLYQQKSHWGILESSNYRLLDSTEKSSNIVGFENSTLPSLEALKLAQRSGLLTTVPVEKARLLAPINHPEKVICIGTNYAEHAREMGGEPPSIPVVFNKFPSTIIGPEDEVILPSISNKVDFEAELVVVIGREGRQIPREHAMEYVFGYCCGNDISARDWQKEKPGGQWLLGKTFDTFAPLGPFLVTPDDIRDPHSMKIQLRLNGQTMQDSSTDQLIFSIDFLISHLSQFTTLKPGDLIFTGTPPGVGAGRKPPLFLKPGDQLEVEIEGIGILKNHVVTGC